MIQNTFLMLDGVGKGKEQKIWNQDILTWNDFLDADSVRGIGEARKQTYDTELHKVKQNLKRRNKAFFNHNIPDRQHWRLFEAFQDSIAYLDIETTGLDRQRNDITTISIYDGREARTLVQGKDLTHERLQEELYRHDLLVTFNGKRFDVPFIKQKFPDIAFEHPHIDLMYECKKIGLSGGLKRIEKELDIGRGDVDGVDGSEAVRLWHRYQRGDDAALARLVKYNKKDVQNLEPLLDIVCSRLYESTFRSVIS